jgi:hypothetical protein
VRRGGPRRAHGRGLWQSTPHRTAQRTAPSPAPPGRRAPTGAARLHDARHRQRHRQKHAGGTLPTRHRSTQRLTMSFHHAKNCTAWYKPSGGGAQTIICLLVCASDAYTYPILWQRSSIRGIAPQIPLEPHQVSGHRCRWAATSATPSVWGWRPLD